MSDTKLTEDEEALNRAIAHVETASEILSAAGYFHRARNLLEEAADLRALCTANKPT